MSNRSILRNKAKKLYKQQIKENKVPKNKRMPFKEFFKQYIKLQHQQQEHKDEDFDFESMVNVSEISDDDVENDN